MDQGKLSWLSSWFSANCDGDWEHSFGLKIETTDNPGWALEIDLTDTALENRNFLTLEIERSETDWLKCWLDNSTFRIVCGARNLPEAILSFRHWAETKT
ncbi:MAG: immunity 53 family protein [Pseudomonadota bacterium]